MEDFTVELQLNDTKNKYVPGDHVKGIVLVECSRKSTNTPINLRLIWSGNATSHDKDAEDSFSYFTETLELEDQSHNSDPSELIFPNLLSFQAIKPTMEPTYVLPSSLALEGKCSFEFEVIVPTRLYLPGTIKKEQADVEAAISYSIVALVDQYGFGGNPIVSKAEVLLAETFNPFEKSGFQSKSLKYSVGTLSKSSIQEFDYSAALSIHVLDARVERGGVIPLIAHITTDCVSDREEIITYLLVRTCCIRIQESNCQFKDTVVCTMEETINMKLDFHQEPKKLDRLLQIPNDIFPTITNNDGIFEVKYKLCVMLSGKDTVYAPQGLPQSRYVIVDIPVWIDPVSKENIENTTLLHQTSSNAKKDVPKKGQIMGMFKRQSKPPIEPPEPVKSGLRESSKALFSFGRNKAKSKKPTPATPPKSPLHSPTTLDKYPPSMPLSSTLDSTVQSIHRVLSTGSSVSYRSFRSSSSLGKSRAYPGIAERGLKDQLESAQQSGDSEETHIKSNTSNDSGPDMLSQQSIYYQAKTPSQVSSLNKTSQNDYKTDLQREESEMDVLYRNILGGSDNTSLFNQEFDTRVTSGISFETSTMTSDGGVETHDLFEESDDESIEEYEARMKALEIKQKEEQQRIISRSKSQMSGASNVRSMTASQPSLIGSSTFYEADHQDYSQRVGGNSRHSNSIFTGTGAKDDSLANSVLILLFFLHVANSEYGLDDLDDDSSSDDDQLIHQVARYDEQQHRLAHFR
ncbi:hypothetical protein CLU79DRAFT_738322 [Phycomyces nitens]|nr:hypothetical protein CLU79DRAFT_738322 [Phycomyces nitens]